MPYGYAGEIAGYREWAVKIAECFKDGDVDRLMNIFVVFQTHCNQSAMPMSSGFVTIHLETISRLREAARLAGDSCK